MGLSVYVVSPILDDFV